MNNDHVARAHSYLKTQSTTLNLARETPASKASMRDTIVLFFTANRFSLKDQVFFAKRLSFLARADVPLMEGLAIIRSQTKSPSKGKVFDDIISDVANGQSLASSIAKHKYFLTDFGVNIIRVGEASGILEQNLTYLADELAKKSVLRKKVIGALIYPLFITVATLGVTGMLTVYIFPKIMPIFVSLHVPLPLTTRILIAVSAYLQVWGLLTLLSIVLLGIGFMALRALYEQVRFRSDYALLYIPLVGGVARSYNLANFCRTMGLMLRSGVQIATAMKITAETTPNSVYRTAYMRIATCIMKGEQMSSQLSREPFLFPSIMTHMIAVGEKTGNLANALGYLSEMYEIEVDDQTKNFSSSIEPVLMIIMGLLVGLIAVSVITPIYGITQHLSSR